MGNSIQPSGNQLKFMQQVEDRHFGLIDIFRSEEGSFVMKMKRTHICGDRRHQEFKQIMQWVKINGNSLIVPIVFSKDNVQKGICIQYEVTDIYTEYYNYTLDDLIAHKKELQEPELWFILESMLRLTTQLRNNKFGVCLQLDNVFLTLKGTICIYFCHIQSFQQSISNHEYGMGQSAAKILIQLINCERIQFREDEGRQLLTLISKVCSRYKLLGKLIKELLNREKTDEEILEDIHRLCTKRQIKMATEVKLNKFKYLIPQQSNSKQLNSENKQNNSKDNSSSKVIDFKPKKSAAEKKLLLQMKDCHTETSLISNKKNKDASQTKKSPLVQIFSNKLEIMDKDDSNKLFSQLEKRKLENKLKMQKFQQRKQELMSQSKENKQNTLQNIGLKNSQNRKSFKQEITKKTPETNKNIHKI